MSERSFDNELIEESETIRNADFDTPLDENITQLVEEMGFESDELVHPSLTQEECINIVSPKKYAHFHCPKTLPLPSLWPSRPLLLRESSTQNVDPMTIRPPVPLDAIPYPFETDLFKGEIIVRLSSNKECASYFAGKRRLNSVVLTGQFKHRVSFADMVTGQEFCHPIKNPGMFLSKALLKVFKLLAPLLKVKLDNEETYFLSPLAQSVQAMHVGVEPYELTATGEIEENTSLLGGALSAKKHSFSQRKKFFSNPKNLEKYFYEPELFYTFDFYNDKISLETFNLHILSKKIDLTPYLLGQPIRVLARSIHHDADINSSTGYAWNFEFWHENQTKNLEKLLSA